MDQIQKVLVEAGRKDLAQKYYKKVAEKVVTDQDIKAYISEHLRGVRDQGFAKVLRDALFTIGKIDWSKVRESIVANMPEVKKFRSL